MNQFGEHIRKLRLDQDIKQREVAAFIKSDSAFISKLEKGERQARREQVILLADLFKVDKKTMLSIWLGEKVYELLKDEETAFKAMKVAEAELKYHSAEKKK